MIEVKSISKKYGDKQVLHNISFSANKGEILGLLGPNGAGKSTTMNIITGYMAPNSGSVTINGYDVSKKPIKAKANLGYLPENPPLYQDMTVKAYLSFIFDLKNIRLGENKNQTKKDKALHIDEICKLVKIDDVYNRLIKNLSKGYKQRIGLAGALLGYPPLLILDEPTVGLDPKQIIEMRNLITKLKNKHTIILSSHVLSEVQMICDRVVVINNGKIVADNNTKNLSEEFLQSNEFIAEVKGDNKKVYEVLCSVNGVIEVANKEQKEDNSFEYLIKVEKNCDARQEIFEKLSEIGCPLLTMQPIKTNLEDIFLKLTEDIPECYKDVKEVIESEDSKQKPENKLEETNEIALNDTEDKGGKM